MTPLTYNPILFFFFTLFFFLRFVVVCSYQSGLQTVRASFSVPGRGGASAVQHDHYEEEERMGRGLKPMNYVDKSALVLRETETTDNNVTSKETDAMVEEMDDPTINYNNSDAKAVATDDTTNAVAQLENIIPGVNEEHIKQQTEVNENEKMYNGNVKKQQESKIKNNIENNEGSSVASTTVNSDDNDDDDANGTHELISAKFAKLTLELNDQRPVNEAEEDIDDSGATPTGRGNNI